ncbi:hypothetical protein [Streptomyces sp. NPDC059957]|uniref:hypothetical protein n=1 Tax=unclassified Streptomyces TaxID=2593676 RepID=UPI0036566499
MGTGTWNGVAVAQAKGRDWGGIAPGAETVAAGQFQAAAVFWQLVQFTEEPYGRGYGGGIGVLFSLAVMCTLQPALMLGVGVVHSALFTTPVMELSNSVGVRTRIPAPWWALPAAGLLAAVYAAPIALLTGSSYVGTWGWTAAAGVLPTVVSVYARMRQKTKASVRRWTLGPAVIAMFAAVVAAFAWPPYEPPVLAHTDYIGVWTGDGVRLELDAQGVAMAEKLLVDDGFEVVDRCSGLGTWKPREADRLNRAGVVLTVPECKEASLTWELAGTVQAPQLFVLIGDPDGGDVRVLRKRAR